MFSAPIGRFTAILVVVILFVINSVSCSETAHLKSLTDDAVILAFGDSLTYGTGVGIEHSYPRVLQKLIKHRVINSGVPGEVTAQGLVRLADVLKKLHPNLVILCHGGNDILKKHAFEKIERNLHSMIKLIKSTGADVILIAIPKFALFPSAAKFYKKLANEFKIPVELDIIVELEKKPTYKSDSVHFNKKGYYKMAQAVELLLQKVGALSI